MPELPEVENTRRYLIKSGLPGRTLIRATISWARSVRLPVLEDFVLGIPGKRVEAVNRRGKYLLLPLDSTETLVLHLGMTGRLRVHSPSQPAPPLLRHTISLDDGRELRFIDPRKIGHLWLVGDPEPIVGALGPEPLDGGFTPEVLAQVLRGRSTPIKALLLEQSVIAGLGNLYADESLYLAGIHPERLASDLSAAEVSRLRDAVVGALTRSVAEYDRARKEFWPDPPFALSPWTIPREAGASCPRCGGPVEMIRVRGRSTYFCPQCQPGQPRKARKP
jgi:formamidopyrimidine-DNA glycosylase